MTVRPSAGRLFAELSPARRLACQEIAGTGVELLWDPTHQGGNQNEARRSERAVCPCFRSIGHEPLSRHGRTNAAATAPVAAQSASPIGTSRRVPIHPQIPDPIACAPRRLYRRHHWRSEGFHGEAKTWHGLARAVRRGLNSIISASKFYNLWVNDLTPLTSLRVRVQDSDLSVSSSGVAVAFDQQPTGATASAVIDLGGGALGSDGRNCIFGGAIYDLEATRYNVSAENDWWGSARGPLPGKVVETVPGYKIDTAKPLRRAPPACNGEERYP